VVRCRGVCCGCLSRSGAKHSHKGRRCLQSDRPPVARGTGTSADALPLWLCCTGSFFALSLFSLPSSPDPPQY
jgi:hypothetical protein